MFGVQLLFLNLFNEFLKFLNFMFSLRGLIIKNIFSLFGKVELYMMKDNSSSKPLLIISMFILIGNCYFVEPPYADWAHTHVVWYNNAQNQTIVLKMADDYLRMQIPVGGFNIDSGWSTCFNDFIWNKSIFPNPQSVIDYFHSNNIKVMLWATSMVNTNCITYQEGKDKGYFLNNGKTIKWWHGQGSFIDFFNPEAVKWWTSQMDKILDMGVDAWKCDGTDPLTIQLRPWPYSAYKKTYIDIKKYSDLYYGTFYNHTKSKNSNALIMARPVDSLKDKAYRNFAPKYVMFSGWVGDQDSTSQGLRDALGNFMHSAWQGYLNFGFDIGGYRGSKNKISKSLFLRWVQVGSMVPFMENGGNGQHQPWSFDQQTVDIYRNFVLIHHSLKSFFLTAGTQAFKKKVSVIQPLAQKQSKVAFSFLQTYGYTIWKTFLVFPIFEQSNIADMMVPEGIWIYYFDHNYILDKRVQARAFPLNQFPIFIKKGSIYPVERQYLNQKYMKNYSLRNSGLNVDEIVLVYPEQIDQNKTFIHRNYTDYLQIKYKDRLMEIKVNRFYRNQDKVSELPKITIRLIGAAQSKKLQISQKLQENQRSLLIDNNKQDILYKYDQQCSNDLVFDIELNKVYELRNIQLKEIKISS